MLGCKNDDETEQQPDPDPETAYYTNPMYLPQQRRDGGVGDPSAIRWMGKYYLTYSLDPIGMWESSDLVNWKYLGTVTEDGEIPWAWAPETMYYEGDFYIYASGPDQNHLALKLETSEQEKPSPFGNYSVVSRNFFPNAVHDIDATSFRDDDGSLYFFFSGVGGIEYIKTESPIDGNKPVLKLENCVVHVPDDPRDNYWTEGPSVIKKDGVYFMTYCGNDVLRVDYQIHAASGSSIESLTPAAVAENPILIHTEGFYNGTGHSNNVLGPDLKTYYTTYHVKHHEGNNQETGKPLRRSLMLDKIEFLPNGDVKSEVTFTQQEAPKLADWSDDFNRTSLADKWTKSGDWTLFNNFAINGKGDNSEITSVEKTSSGNYIVEGYVKVKSNAVGGIVVANGNIKAYLDHNNKKLIVMNGSNTTNIELPQSNFDAWHELKISINNGNLIVWLDNMQKHKESYAGVEKSSVTYKVENGAVDFAWVAFSSY